MKRYLSSLFVSSLFLLSAYGYSAEGTKISVHQVTLGVEHYTQGGGPYSSVGMDQDDLFEQPIVLTLEKEQPDESGRAPAGDIYSDSVVKTVTIQGVEFDVKVEASVQVIDGKEGAYSVSASVKRKGQRFFEYITGVSTKTAAGLKEVVSVSGWSKESFWINKETKKVGRVRVILDVNEYDPFGF